MFKKLMAKSYVWRWVIPPYEPSKLGRVLLTSLLGRPDDWYVDKHTANHIPSGLEVWVCNDISNRRLYRIPGKDQLYVEELNKLLSASDRVAIDEAVQRLRERSPEMASSVKTAQAKRAALKILEVEALLIPPTEDADVFKDQTRADEAIENGP